jgi:hypothetical protein
MHNETKLALGAATLAVLGLGWIFREDLEQAMNATIDLAKSLWAKTTIVDGVVCLKGSTTPAAPESLATMEGVDLDTYALARMIESEAGNLNTEGKQAVAFAALTYARKAGRSISDVLLRASGAGNGYFGTQEHARYASTSKDPSQSAYDAVIYASSGLNPDPTGGADQWDSPWSYKGSDTETPQQQADRVESARRAAGKIKVVLASVPERKLRFWRKANG